MEITREDLTHLAELSNFSLSESEMTSLTKDLQNIVKYISELDKLDVKNVEPTYQVFEMENVWRPDSVEPTDREALLSLTTETTANQIKVPKVL